VKEVFRLQNADELLAAEERYLPRRNESTRAIILAATQGSELGDLTKARPKSMVPINGVPLLHKLVGQFRKEGVKDVAVVRGFAKEEVNAPDVWFVDNDRHADSGELQTLACAAEALDGEVIISYGDILFRRYILSVLLDSREDLSMVVDAAVQEREQIVGCHDYVRASRPYTLRYSEEEVYLEEMSPGLPRDQANGEWMGLIKASPKGVKAIKAALAELGKRDDFRQLQLHDLFNHLVRGGHPIRVVYITGHWLDVDNLEDLSQAQAF
jgi:phosphoenolpyruvate phosphomutase